MPELALVRRWGVVWVGGRRWVAPPLCTPRCQILLLLLQKGARFGWLFVTLTAYYKNYTSAITQMHPRAWQVWDQTPLKILSWLLPLPPSVAPTCADHPCARPTARAAAKSHPRPTPNDDRRVTPCWFSQSHLSLTLAPHYPSLSSAQSWSRLAWYSQHSSLHREHSQERASGVTLARKSARVARVARAMLTTFPPPHRDSAPLVKATTSSTQAHGHSLPTAQWPRTATTLATVSPRAVVRTSYVPEAVLGVARAFRQHQLTTRPQYPLGYSNYSFAQLPPMCPQGQL